MSDTKIMGERKDFATTSWTLVRAARDVRALETLITIYWKPLYFFVRRRGYDNETAKDLVQEFLSRMIERGDIVKADPARGRFRTFLLACLTNFMRDWVRSETREKRRPTEPIVSLDFAKGEEEYTREPATEETPEKLLDRMWARSLLDHSLRQLEGDPAHVEAFRLYWMDTDYATISERTGLTEAAARTAVHRLKGQLRTIISGILSHTASDPGDFTEEVTEFLSLLR